MTDKIEAAEGLGHQVGQQIRDGMNLFLEEEVRPRFENMVEGFHEDAANVQKFYNVEEWDIRGRELYDILRDALTSSGDHFAATAEIFLSEEYALADVADMRSMVEETLSGDIKGMAVTYLAGVAINTIVPMAEQARGARRKLAMKRQAIGLFWPPHLDRDSPSMAGRAGRVLHWIGAGAGWLWVAGGGAAWIVQIDADPNFAWGMGLSLAAAGVASALVGRGLRYILASE
jgi:hypothetical protein